MKTITRLGLIGVLTVAGMTAADANDWDNTGLEPITLSTLSYADSNTELQLVHRRSFRHSHRRGFRRGFRSRGLNSSGHRRHHYGSSVGFNRELGFGHGRRFNSFGRSFHH